MDLKSVLNTSDNGDRAPSNIASTPQLQRRPQHHQHPHHQQPHHPSVESAQAQYGYHDYAQGPPQPRKPVVQPYPQPAQHRIPPNVYAQQPQYQQRPGPYPAPPPVQPPQLQLQMPGPFIDSAASSRAQSAPTASQYRPSPTTAISGAGAGYQYAPAQQPMPQMTSPVQQMIAATTSSPIQRHQYPPTRYQAPRRGSNSERHAVAAPAPPPLQPQPQLQPPAHAVSPHVQQQPVPQAPPPIVTAVASSHPYHQRSQSTHSAPTPTSTQGQHHYGPSYAQGSPILAPQPPPSDYNNHNHNHNHHHPSQPPTPLGPPQPAAPRQSSAPGSFAQPTSPYQQRLPLTLTGRAQAHPSPKPAHPPPPSHRLSDSHSTYKSPVLETNQRPQSRHERERSLSVSPKTRVEFIPSNPPDRVAAPADTDSRPSPGVQAMAVDSDRAATPAKRKLGDRSMSPRELEHRESRPAPGEVNGGYADRIKKSASPAAPPRKTRTARAQPPIWAQSARTLGKNLPNHANFVLQKRVHSHIRAPVNGRHESTAKAERASRHASPETTRQRHVSSSQAPPPPPESGPQDLLGPWEASITGVKPFEELSKNVADFLFIHVINNPDMQEISSRGIQFEIEAKLGTLIDKDTNRRVDRFIDSECVLQDNGRVAFKSSMTEAHHKAFNEFLNNIVIQTDPRNPSGGSRVQVHYKHRREIDRFFELPTELQGRLPGCMRALLGSRSRNVRVRVTYDQKTKEVLNKIIKARVADIDLHMPMCPMDCRISINLEMNWDGSVEELEQSGPKQGDRQPDRSKDRLSYTQGHYQIDLTQVVHSVSGPGGSLRMEKEHELEIELSADALVDQGRRAMSGAPHRYQELVEGLVDNVRVLARKVKEFTKA